LKNIPLQHAAKT